MLRALCPGWPMNAVPKVPTPLLLWDTWKLVALAPSAQAMGSQTHLCNREKSKNIKSSLKIWKWRECECEEQVGNMLVQVTESSTNNITIANFSVERDGNLHIIH